MEPKAKKHGKHGNHAKMTPVFCWKCFCQCTTTELAVGCSSSLYMEVAIGEFKYARRNYRPSSQMIPKTHWTPNFSEAQLLPCSLVQWLSWFYLTNPKCGISTCVPTMVSYHVISYTSLTNAKGCVKIYIYIASVHDPSPLYHSGSTSILYVGSFSPDKRCGGAAFLVSFC